MATLPQSPPAGKSLALMRTRPRLPLLQHAAPALEPVHLTSHRCSVFWCGTCLRPVCLEPPAGPDRPGVEVAHASA